MAHKTVMHPIEIIVGVDAHGGFGKDGRIPWSHPDDLKRFKKITTGHICVMGRKTYDDMLDMRIERERKKKEPAITFPEILPKRESYVITSNPKHYVIGATIKPGLRDVVNSLDEKDSRTVFVIGGERLFIEALSWTRKIHMTIVDGSFDCDVFFPLDYVNNHFTITSAEQSGDLKFVTYER